VTSSQTLSLAPGQYTVSAEPVLTGQFVMGPTAPARTVTVALGHSATVTVSYNTLRALALRLVEVIARGLTQPIFLAAPPGDATAGPVADGSVTAR
jgi:hypothetical protein